MQLEHVPLLQVQRDLYALPRGLARFQEYLRTMIDARSGDLKLPLVAMNPMGKEHMPPFLDRLLEMEAEAAALQACAETQSSLQSQPGRYRVGLVVSDDLRGGWTNRYTSEFEHRFRGKAMHKRGWIPVLLWTSETYAPAQIAEEVRQCVFRAAYVQCHGYARTLGEMLAQEGAVMLSAGCSAPALDAEDLAYTRAVLAPLLAAADPPTVIPALYGDAAAAQLGYRRLGLSPRAGLALALQSRSAGQTLTSEPCASTTESGGRRPSGSQAAP